MVLRMLFVLKVVLITFSSSEFEGMSPEDKEEWGITDLEESSSASKFGVNLGAGVQYDVNETWAVNFEVKYQLISDFNQAVFGLGVAYKF